jgi:hypothetical protein
MESFVCAYKFENDSAMNGYLELEGTVDMQEIHKYFADQFKINPCVILNKKLEEIHTFDQLKGQVEDRLVNVVVRDTASVRANQWEEAEPVGNSSPPKFCIGDAIRELLKFYNVTLNNEYSSAEEFFASVPFGQVMKARLSRIRKCPRYYERRIGHFAAIAGINAEQLMKETNVILDNLEANAVRPPTLCSACKESIIGARFECLHCNSFILCTNCEFNNHRNGIHQKGHIFAKLTGADQKLDRKVIKGPVKQNPPQKGPVKPQAKRRVKNPPESVQIPIPAHFGYMMAPHPVHLRPYPSPGEFMSKIEELERTISSLRAALGKSDH